MSKFQKNHKPHNFKDISGRQFAEWLVIEASDKRSDNNKIYWLCKNLKTNELCLKTMDTLRSFNKRIGKTGPRFARTQAKKDGKTKYFSGRECVNGHVSERWTATGTCCECMTGFKKKMYKNRRKITKNRIDDSIRSRLYLSLKKSYRSKKYEDIFGYSLEDLASHIERQFIGKMSWDNYGSYWHIDHIRPLSSFNYQSIKDQQFLDCWCLSNLRPLAVKDNISKKDKRIFLV